MTWVACLFQRFRHVSFFCWYPSHLVLHPAATFLCCASDDPRVADSHRFLVGPRGNFVSKLTLLLFVGRSLEAAKPSHWVNWMGTSLLNANSEDSTSFIASHLIAVDIPMCLPFAFYAPATLMWCLTEWFSLKRQALLSYGSIPQRMYELLLFVYVRDASTNREIFSYAMFH